MPFSANAPAYSDRLNLVSQSAISCIAAHARLNFGLVDPLDGRFYPIDRAARNRPKQSAAGMTGGPRPEEPQAGASLQAAAAGRAPLGPFTHREVFTCIIPSKKGPQAGACLQAAAVGRAPLGPFTHWEVFTCIVLSKKGGPSWLRRPSERKVCGNGSAADFGDLRFP
jgi:hypothetical protein